MPDFLSLRQYLVRIIVNIFYGNQNPHNFAVYICTYYCKEVSDALNFLDHIHSFSQYLDFSSEDHFIVMFTWSLSREKLLGESDYVGILYKSLDLYSGAPALIYVNHSGGP